MAKKIKNNTAKRNSIKVYYDHIGNTLNVWFGNPDKEYVSEEVGDDVILNKDRQGHVIGFERINFKPRVAKGVVAQSLPVEVFVH